MKRWRFLWFLLSIAISSGVYLTLRYGLRPKPVPVTNATQFEDLQQIGAVLYKRLRQNIRPERLIVLGSSGEVAGDPEIWQGFLKAAGADKVNVRVLFQLEGATPVLPLEGVETVAFGESQIASGEFSESVRARLRAGQLVIVHGPTRRVTHLVKDSLSRTLDTILRHPVLSISSLPATLEPEHAMARQEACEAMREKDERESRVDCAIARVSRTMSKKRLAADKIWSVFERHGLQEYLVFVYKE